MDEHAYHLWWPQMPVAIGVRCNFACPYCFSRDHDGREVSRLEAADELWTVQDVREAADRTYRDHGAGRFHVGGPEPTQCLDALEALTEHHSLVISSNLSFDPDEVARRLGDRVDIAVSYHPTEWPSVEAFVERFLHCREVGLRVGGTSIVAWPPLLSRLGGWVEALRAAEIACSIHQFQGEWQGTRYPAAYTDEERALIDALAVSTTGPTQYAGLCRAGMTSASVRANGDVVRCPNDAEALGNIRTGITWHTEPQPCRADVCTCQALSYLRC